MPEISGSFICFFDEKFIKEKSIVVGGFLISKNDLQELDRLVINIKESMSLEETDPVKWNMSKCPISLRKIGNDRVLELRRKMISLANQLPIKIIMSHVWMGSSTNKTRAWKWAFDNILQRLSIILDQKRNEINNLDHYPFMDVVFDWFPGRAKLNNFFDVYQNAYINGFSNLPRNQRPLPPFRDFKACPCLVASSSYYSLALQFVDFLIGITDDFFVWCYLDRKEQSVKDYFPNCFDAFRKSQGGNPIGYGLIVKDQSKAKIRGKLRELDLLTD